MLFQVLVWWEAWQDLSFVKYFCSLFFKEMNSNSEFLIMHNPRWLLMVSQLLLFLIFFCFCIITFIKIAVWFKSSLPCIWPQNLIKFIDTVGLQFLFQYNNLMSIFMSKFTCCTKMVSARWVSGQQRWSCARPSGSCQCSLRGVPELRAAAVAGLRSGALFVAQPLFGVAPGADGDRDCSQAHDLFLYFRFTPCW